MKKFLLILVAVLALGWVVWWNLRPPYAPERVYECIPSEAWLVSSHYALGPRLPELLSNPTLRTLLTAMEIDGDALSALVAESGTRSLIERAASDRSVLAWLPRIGGQPSAWAVATWVGGAAGLLNTFAGSIEGVQEYEDGKRRYFVLFDATNDGRSLSFGVVDGMLLACLSAESTAVNRLFDTLEGGPIFSVARHTAQEPFRQMRDWAGEAPDCGIFYLHKREKVTIPALQFKFDRVSARGVQGALRARMSGSTGASMDLSSLFVELDAWTGGQPLAVLATEAPMTLPGLLQHGGQPELGETLGGFIESSGTQAAALALLGEAHSGRLFGMKVPSLVLALKVDPKRALKAMPALLGKINTVYGTTIEAESLTGPEGRFFALTDRSDEAQDIDPVERPAYTLRDDWLIVCSNLGALKTMCADPPAPGAPAEWQQAWNGGTAFWMDAERGGETLNKIVAVYALGEAFGKDPEARLKVLDYWQVVLAQFREIERVEMALQQGEQHSELSFRLGPGN